MSQNKLSCPQPNTPTHSSELDKQVVCRTHIRVIRSKAPNMLVQPKHQPDQLVLAVGGRFDHGLHLFLTCNLPISEYDSLFKIEKLGTNGTQEGRLPLKELVLYSELPHTTVPPVSLVYSVDEMTSVPIDRRGKRNVLIEQCTLVSAK
jgi:hypothetical protein